MKNEYGHWTGPDTPALPDAWLLAAVHGHEGSWWPHRDRWLEPVGGDEVPARAPDDGDLRVIEDAPGCYATRPMPESRSPGCR